MNEDASAPPGATVASLFAGALFTDPDNAAETINAIAVTTNAANAGTEGAWQYSTNGGANWFAIGAVAAGTALVLNDNALVRFAPVANYNGAPTALLVRGVDSPTLRGLTSGATRVTVDASVNGGTTAISGGTATIGTTITAQNDAPTLTGAGLAANVTEASSAPISRETQPAAAVQQRHRRRHRQRPARRCQVRISVNFQSGATHQDLLKINGLTSGTDRRLRHRLHL